MNDRHQGILVGPREAGRQPETRINEAGLRAGTPPDGAAAMSVPYGLPFAGLFFYTVLIYVRPQELFPGLFGSFPLVKIVAIATLLVYFFASVSAGRRLTVWPIELKVVLFIAFLCILFTPIAAAPQDSLDGLFETFLKVVIMFVVTINVLNTRERLRSIMALSVICGTFLAWLAISNYSEGNFYMTKSGRSTGRIAGAVDEGLFGNPNDLATGLLLLLPFAVAFALTNRGSKRVLYIAGAILMTVGIVVTFSRGGFLGLVGVGVVLLWKLSKRRRGLSILAFSVVTGIFLVAMPGGYAGRLTTIVSIDDDPTGSAQARRELLKRATAVAANHPVIGVGMKNFHIYSIQEQVAHNSFLEIAAELGLAGLLAFLILIFSPLRSLRRLERETINQPQGMLNKGRDGPQDEQVYYFSVALQASLIAFIICGFFGSMQYHYFVYVPVAYAVALRQVYAGERSGIEAAVGKGQDEPHTDAGRGFEKERKVGVIWKPTRLVRKSPAHGISR